MALDAIDNVLHDGSKRNAVWEEKRRQYLAKRNGAPAPAPVHGGGPGPTGAPRPVPFEARSAPQPPPPRLDGPDMLDRAMASRPGSGPPPSQGSRGSNRGYMPRDAPQHMAPQGREPPPFAPSSSREPQYGQSGRGEPPYGGQSSRGEPPYGQSSRGEPPYGQSSRGEPPYGQSSRGEPPYGQSSRGEPQMSAPPPRRSDPPFDIGMQEPPSSAALSQAPAPAPRPPVAPGLSAKEEYARELRAQMAEKDAARRGRGRPEEPRESAVRGSSPQVSEPAFGGDRRSQQLEYAQALQQQMQDNAARRGPSRSRQPAAPQPDPSPHDAWCGGGPDQRTVDARQAYAAELQQQMRDNAQRKAGNDLSNHPLAREWEPDRVANRPEPDRRAAQMEYRAALEQQMNDNAARRPSPARRRGTPEQSSGGGFAFQGEPAVAGSRDRRQEARDEYARDLRAQMAEKQSRAPRAEQPVQAQQAPRPAGGYAVKQPPGGFSQGLW